MSVVQMQIGHNAHRPHKKRSVQTSYRRLYLQAFKLKKGIISVTFMSKMDIYRYYAHIYSVSRFKTCIDHSKRKIHGVLWALLFLQLLQVRVLTHLATSNLSWL